MSLTTSLPADDRRLSPITGWGLEHWLHCADTLLAGAHRYSSPGHARVRFPSEQSQDATDELGGLPALSCSARYGLPPAASRERT